MKFLNKKGLIIALFVMAFGSTIAQTTSGGNITADGGSPITARGVVWATTTNPTVINPEPIKI